MKRYKVVRAYQVENLTEQGWEIEDIRDSDVTEGVEQRCQIKVNGEGNCPVHGYQTHRGYPCGQQTYELRQMRVPLFVMVLSEERAAEARADKTRDLTMRIGGLEHTLMDYELKLPSLEKKLEAAQEMIDQIAVDNKSLGERNSQLIEANRKLEEDIGKLREEFGAAAVRKALGEERL